MKSFSSFLNEVAPPGDKAEEWIKSNKEEFKKQYGDEWEEVLYATAWKMFGKSESIEERMIGAEIAAWLSKTVFSADYKHALQTLVDMIKRKKAESKLTHDVNYYSERVAKSYRHVDGRELAKLYNALMSESEAAANTTAGVATADAPFKVGKVAGCDCIEVDCNTYMNCKFGKKPYARWNGYVEDEQLRTFVQKHYSKSKSLMIVNKDTGAASYLRR